MNTLQHIAWGIATAYVILAFIARLCRVGNAAERKGI